MSNRVLVIDVDRSIRETVALFLEMEGYSVIQAPGCLEALKLLNDDSKVTAILLDLRMPGMKVTDFQRERLRHTVLAAIPLMVMSADNEAKKVAKEIKADASIQKPFSPDNL